MMHLSATTLIVLLAIAAPIEISQKSETKSVTWTGWFSDAQCAGPRVKNGNIGPNGTECVKRCLAEGAKAVFISEQAKAMFDVLEYPSVREDVGFHLEVTGAVDEKAQTIAVHSVKRLSEVVPSCGQPKPKKGTN